MDNQQKRIAEIVDNLAVMAEKIADRLEIAADRIENLALSLNGRNPNSVYGEVAVPVGYRPEDGFSEELSYFGGRKHWRIEQALKALANSGDVLARRVAENASPYTIVTFQNFPDLKPNDPEIARRAGDALSRNFSRAAMGIQRANAWGVNYDENEVPEGEELSRHVTLWVADDFDLDAWAARTAEALMQGPERIREQVRQEEEDEANGVIKPTPGPRPRPLP